MSKLYTIKRTKRCGWNEIQNMQPMCCQVAQFREPLAWLEASFWMSKDQPPTKALVKHLRPPKWGSNHHQTTTV